MRDKIAKGRAHPPDWIERVRKGNARRRKFVPEVEAAIRRLHAAGKSQHWLAREFGADRRTIHRLLKRQ
jgi:DNA invertase Pin-like site-specific DNA recombinase